MNHLSNLETIRELLKKHNISPSKKLGQNFLVDESALETIVETSDISPDETLVEIGPGLGVLTIELAKRANKVIAIEKDKNMAEILADTLTALDIKNVDIINADALSDDYELSAYGGSPAGRQITSYKLIANLPYYITSPLIRKFLEIENKPELIVLMVQKEVAERMTSKKKMNLLAIAVQFYAEVEIIKHVPKESFWPEPKVNSAIIKITPHNKIPLNEIDTKQFFKLVKIGFSAKRKMLTNNLLPIWKQKELTKQDLETLLKKIGLNPKTRAESLTIKDWLKLLKEFKLCI